ncbi:MAG: hypothetical protein IPI67_17875 [Myxococcales bacterium]|nr:hypothetical protein [Myxococcales bacterium]
MKALTVRDVDGSWRAPPNAKKAAFLAEPDGAKLLRQALGLKTRLRVRVQPARKAPRRDLARRKTWRASSRETRPMFERVDEERSGSDEDLPRHLRVSHFKRGAPTAIEVIDAAEWWASPAVALGEAAHGLFALGRKSPENEREFS